MNNYTSLFIAVLEHLHLLTEDEAKKLAKELHNSTLPGTYEEASRLLKDIYDKLDVKTLGSKVEATKKVLSSELPTLSKIVDGKK